MPLVTLSRKGLSHRQQQLRELKRMDMSEFLRWLAKVATQTLMKWTAPHGQHPESETWPDQKKLGEHAVSRDIHDLWKPANSVLPEMEAKDPHAAQYARNYIRRGKLESLRTLLLKMGFTDTNEIVLSVTETMHDQRRSAKTGRAITGKGRWRILVLRSNSIIALARKKKNDVGKWKSGWGASAARLGLSGRDWPAWVRRHGNNGRIVDNSTRSVRPGITLINDVKAPTAKAADAERALNVTRAKLERMAKIQVESILKRRMAKMNARA